MAVPLQPSVWLTFRLEQVPEGTGTTVYRWAAQPLADAGAWKEGRVTSWGDIERALSTPDGDYDIAQCQVTIDDSDGLFRGLLSGVATRYFTNREAAIELLSQAGRAAGTTPRMLFRGRVSDVQAEVGRTVTLKISDIVGGRFSGFDLDKLIPQVKISEAVPNAEEKVRDRVVPIIVGEHTDVGVVDENGAAADKGLLPVVDVGDTMVRDDGSDVPADVVPVRLGSPTGLTAASSGTIGTTAYRYGVTAFSEFGETTESATITIIGPDILNGTDYVDLTWDAVEGAVRYVVYGRHINTGRRFLASVSTATFHDDGSASMGSTAPPATNTAQVVQDVGGGTAFGWGMLVVGLGAIDVHHVYASDLSAGAQPKRVRMPESAYGSDILAPGRAGWPFADDYLELNGVRFTAVFARGERLAHHRNGTVTIAVNGCGAEDVGDGSGEMIDEAFLALQWFINEHVLKDSGIGYRTGNYGPLETYFNGDSMLQTTKVAACQALTVDWMGGSGYIANWALTEPISLREFLRRFCVTFACHIGTNHFGQVFPVLIDDTADPTDGRLYRDRIEIRSLVAQDFDHDAVETKVTGHYSWDADAQDFRFKDIIIEDTVASAYHLAPRERSVRQCYYTHDQSTFVDSMSRHLTRYKLAPRYLAFQTDLTGLEDENGEQVRVTHYDGAGGVDGDDETPMLVMKHRVDPNAPENVTLTCFDLQRILTTSFPLLATDVSSGVLGDETSTSDPTTGAYELR
jgi:hypothetical protein